MLSQKNLKQRLQEEKTWGGIVGVTVERGQPHLDDNDDTDEEQYVCAINAEQSHDEGSSGCMMKKFNVSIDSGSDADTWPLEVAMMGVRVNEHTSALQCVIGSTLTIYMEFMMLNLNPSAEKAEQYE